MSEQDFECEGFDETEAVSAELDYGGGHGHQGDFKAASGDEGAGEHGHEVEP